MSDKQQPKSRVGERVEIVQDGTSWGEGMIVQEHRINGEPRSYRVHRDVGIDKVVRSEDIRPR